MADNESTDKVRNRRAEAVKLVSEANGRGKLDGILAEAFYGFNSLQNGINLPHNKDMQGFVFFSRPRMNLSQYNAQKSRILSPLLTNDSNSLQRAVRTLLDPVAQNGGSRDHFSHRRDKYLKNKGSTFDIEFSDKDPNDTSNASVANVDSPWVDNKNVFMPILSNAIVSLTGWPDISMETYRKEGIAAQITADDWVRDYGDFDLQATFRNARGDVISTIFRSWIEYMGNVYSGAMAPYPDSLVENEIDYQTRIWRLVLDEKRKYVQKIASAVGCIPIGLGIGANFNLDKNRPYVEDLAEIPVPFRCVGYEYNDPILIREFNDFVLMFNTDLRWVQLAWKEVYEANLSSSGSDARTNKVVIQTNSHANWDYIKLVDSEWDLFAFDTYFLIDEKTNELERWVERSVYEAKAGVIEVVRNVTGTGSVTATAVASNEPENNNNSGRTDPFEGLVLEDDIGSTQYARVNRDTGERNA